MRKRPPHYPNRENRREIWEKDLETSEIVRVQSSGVRGQRSEVAKVVDQILANQADDGLLARIYTELTPREQEVLWAFVIQPDDYELAFLLNIEPQNVRNHVADIKSKLLIKSRPAMLSRVLLALWRESKKS